MLTSEEAIAVSIGGMFRRKEWLAPDNGGENADLSDSTATTTARLYELIERARGHFRAVDKTVERLNTDENLSGLGRARERKRIAVETIKDLQSGVTTQAIALQYNRRVGELEAVVQQVLAPPSTAHAIAVSASIRDFIAAKGPEKLPWLHKHAGDRLVVATVMNAPAFLFDMTEAERDSYLKAAQRAIHPQEAAELELLAKAWGVTTKAVENAERMIIERAKIKRALDGQTWLAEGEVDTTTAPRLAA